MKTRQFIYRLGQWNHPLKSAEIHAPDLILCFGSKNTVSESEGYYSLIRAFPHATTVFSTTAGEINNDSIEDETLVATAINFEHTATKPVKINMHDYADSFQAGAAIIDQLDKENLRFVFVLADGHFVNGSDLVSGINQALNLDIPVSGGLAGDGANFQKTLVGLNQDVQEGNIVAIGFYGERLQVRCGSKGGWGQFGPTRTITRSDKNVLYEIDGENALELYKKYLGEYADQLPGSALLFPITIEKDGEEVVRTILNIDQEKKTMTFAGNMPQGAKARLMKANLDDLVIASSEAAGVSKMGADDGADNLAILISCVGRKLIFGNRIEEELEAARDVLGETTTITGFYSYGEISSLSSFSKCQLHNQTMTITCLSEA